MRELGGEVVSAGLVDTAAGAREAGDRFARPQVDLVLCHAVTYATSSQVLPAVQAAKVPVVLLGLQPTASLDYENTGTGEWLANCAACCVPELAGAFTRARIPYDTVAGTIDGDERAWAKIAAWVRAAGVARALRALADRLHGPHVSRHARHVLGLHRRARAARRARRGARDRRPRRARRGRDGRGGRRQASPRSARCSTSPTRPTTRSPGRSRTTSSTGRRASRSGSTGWRPTSSSTG